MAVSLTEAAARHVTRYLARRGKGVGVRLGVKTTGCSGLAYKLEYADDIAPEDHVFEGHGVKVIPSTADISAQRRHPCSRYVPWNRTPCSGAGRSGNARCSSIRRPSYSSRRRRRRTAAG